MQKKGFKPAVRLNGTSDIDWNIHGLYEEFKKLNFMIIPKYINEL
jgi:hypothetical protein